MSFGATKPAPEHAVDPSVRLDNLCQFPSSVATYVASLHYSQPFSRLRRSLPTWERSLALERHSGGPFSRLSGPYLPVRVISPSSSQEQPLAIRGGSISDLSVALTSVSRNLFQGWGAIDQGVTSLNHATWMYGFDPKAATKGWDRAIPRCAAVLSSCGGQDR